MVCYIAPLLLGIALIVAGCSLSGSTVTPRSVDCIAECTPDRQFIECKGTSEGSQTQDLNIKGK